MAGSRIPFVCLIIAENTGEERSVRPIHYPSRRANPTNRAATYLTVVLNRRRPEVPRAKSRIDMTVTV